MHCVGPLCIQLGDDVCRVIWKKVQDTLNRCFSGFHFLGVDSHCISTCPTQMAAEPETSLSTQPRAGSDWMRFVLSQRARTSLLRRSAQASMCATLVAFSVKRTKVFNSILFVTEKTMFTRLSNCVGQNVVSFERTCFLHFDLVNSLRENCHLSLLRC